MVFWPFLGGECIIKGFDARFIWLMEIHVDRFLVGGGERYAKVVGGMDRLEDIECGFHVASSRKHEIGGYGGVNDGEVRTSVIAKPADTSNQVLVCGSAPFLGRRFIVLVCCYNGIDGHNGTIRSG